MEIPPDIQNLKEVVGEIQKRISELENRTPERINGLIKKDFEPFFLRYPSLSNLLASGSFEQERLQYILNMHEQVTEGEVTLEGASEQVGQSLFDQYVEPNLETKK
jgi:hypothetical protein